MRRGWPSLTAQSVAQCLLFLARHPRYGSLVAPGEAAATRSFLRAVPGLSGVAPRLFELPGATPLAAAATDWALPGIAVHIGVRKRWIESGIREQLARGARQVVVLGAGFDALAYRLHGEFPEVAWWEIDHPDTQVVKRRALEHRTGPNLRLVAADFGRRALTDELEAIQGFRVEAPTAFVAEGVLMYLSDSEIEDLLRSVRELSGRGSLLIGSALSPDSSGRLAFEGARRLVNLALRGFGEPFRSGQRPVELKERLAALGFDPAETVAVADALAEFLGATAPELPRGEYLFRAWTRPSAGAESQRDERRPGVSRR